MKPKIIVHGLEGAPQEVRDSVLAMLGGVSENIEVAGVAGDPPKENKKCAICGIVHTQVSFGDNDAIIAKIDATVLGADIAAYATRAAQLCNKSPAIALLGLITAYLIVAEITRAEGQTDADLERLAHEGIRILAGDVLGGLK